MACNNNNCGCTTPGKTTLPGCDTFICNDVNPCPATVDSCCTIYTGDDIVDANISRGQSLCDIIPQLVTYMTPPEPEPITCSTPTNCCGSVTGFYIVGYSQDLTDSTKYQVQLHWDTKPNCEILGYTLEYKYANSLTWTSISVPSVLTSFFITDLIGGVNYEYRIYINCEAEPCYSVIIKDAPPTPSCTDVNYCGKSLTPAVTAVTDTLISYTWPVAPNVISYEITIVAYDQPNGTTTTTYISLPPSPSPSYTATGLTPGIKYDFNVKGLCPDDNTKCVSIGYIINTKFLCKKVQLTNTGTVADTFGYRTCVLPEPQFATYTLPAGQTVTLCVVDGSLYDVNITTNIVILGSCP